MLLRFTIKNFLSFYDEVVFDMFPNPKRERLTSHIYRDVKIPVLKQAAIYGANGSGKSNFVKAVLFLKSIVTVKDFIKNTDLNRCRFQLADNNEEPIRFEVEFLWKDRLYAYIFEYTTEICEQLVLVGLEDKEDEVLFERKGIDIVSKYIQNLDSSRNLLKLNPQSSILSLNREFPVLIDETIDDAFDWFQNQLDVVTIESTIPALISLMSENDDLLKFANHLFEKIGVGVSSIKVDTTPVEKWVNKINDSGEITKMLNQSDLSDLRGIASLENRRNIFDISMKNGQKVVQEFAFEQMGLSGYKKKMDITAQSDGTVRLLTLIPAIYFAIKGSKVVFIDEIDNCIHPKLVYSLIDFFSNSESNGQLIFTTHTTYLLDQQKLMRPDEIWITEKVDGNTRMRSLNDFKIHNTINLENGYLDGRYGGIPNISDLNEDE